MGSILIANGKYPYRLGVAAFHGHFLPRGALRPCAVAYMGGSVVRAAQPVPQRGFLMCMHSPSPEDRHEPLQTDAESDHSTSINQALLDVIERYENESLAEAWLIAQRWPNGVHCPECDSDNIARVPNGRPQPFRCRACRTQFSVTSHSALRSSKHSLGTWVIAFHFCSALSNPDAVDIRDVLPVTNKAAWNLAMRIHEAWEFYRRNPRASSAQRRLL